MAYEIKDSGNRRAFETGSVRDMAGGKGRYDLIPPEALRRLAVHYEKGAIKYGDKNWQKGQPIHVYTDSMLRHAQKVLARFEDEDHLAAVMWNAAAIIYTRGAIRSGDLPESLEDLFTDKEFESFYGRCRNPVPQCEAETECPNHPVAEGAGPILPTTGDRLVCEFPNLPEGLCVRFADDVRGILGQHGVAIRQIYLVSYIGGWPYGEIAVGYLSHDIVEFVEPTEREMRTYNEWCVKCGRLKFFGDNK